jgi:hypothetical protein
MPKRSRVLIFFLSLLCCISYNEINKYFVRENNPSNELRNAKSVVHGSTIWSVDNFWYLTQPKNFLEGKGFLLDPQNPYTSVRRTPGYSIFYLTHVVLFGEKYAHRIITYSQSVLFALSALALALSVFNFTQSGKKAFLTGIIYGCNPFTSGFVYYTITEAIHPAFVIFGLYFLSKALRVHFNKNGFIAGLFFAIACLIRPLNGLALAAGIVMLFFGTSDPYYNKFKKILVVCFGFLILVLPWTIRNYIVTKGEIVMLEKIYHEDPMYMGKKQTYLSKWWMCWGNPKQEAFIDSLKNEISTGQQGFISRFLANLPACSVRGYTKDELSTVLHEYKDCMHSEISSGVYGIYYKPADTLPACEEKMKSEFEDIIREYKQAAPFRYYIVSPLLIRGKEFFLTSFSSMYGSLNPEKRNFNIVQKVSKGIMYLFNVGLYISFFIFLFFINGEKRLKIFVAFFVITTFLFVVYNVHIESRYLLAAYPFMAVSAAAVVAKISYLKKWSGKSI